MVSLHNNESRRIHHTEGYAGDQRLNTTYLLIMQPGIVLSLGICSYRASSTNNFAMRHLFMLKSHQELYSSCLSFRTGVVVQLKVQIRQLSQVSKLYQWMVNEVVCLLYMNAQVSQPCQCSYAIQTLITNVHQCQLKSAQSRQQG